MKILIFSPGYPDSRKSEYPFVKQLVDEWAEQGHHCTVIATYSITKNRRFCKFRTEISHKNGGKVTILRPNILTFSNIRFLGLNLTSIAHKRGVLRAIGTIKEKQDFVYAHFWQSGADAFLYSKHNNIPLFVASGESNIECLFNGSDRSFLPFVKGVICVSSKNREESVSLGLADNGKCRVFPNAINPGLFKKMDKKECREKLGLRQEDFIVVFVGAFKESKGPDRVSNALNMISGKPVYSIFIGSGGITPTANNMLFNGRLLHTEIPVYLNAADIFVLPTLAEGCCNAIVEAMACGLPIISSNLPFNWDILNSENSIMIDPNNVDEISQAIVTLRDCPEKRHSMAEASLRTVENLTIEKRASDILEYIKECGAHS